MTELPRYPIKINSFEAGYLTSLIWKSDSVVHLKKVFEQLMELQNKFMEEAGVRKTLLPDGNLQLEDEYGNKMIRPPHPWEEAFKG